MRQIPAVVAALAILATGAYPPWKESYVVRAEMTANESGTGDTGDHPSVAAAVATEIVSTAIGNDWLITQKSFPGKSLLAGDSLPTLRLGIGYSVDYGRLAVEWAIIAVLYAALRRLFYAALIATWPSPAPAAPAKP